MIEVREYETEDGEHPFGIWFLALNTPAALKITTAIARMEEGNLSNAKAVGQGVREYKVNFGPGYRVYFGNDGNTVVILLAGGTKKRQSRDIAVAQDRWRNYKRRKRQRD